MNNPVNQLILALIALLFTIVGYGLAHIPNKTETKPQEQEQIQKQANEGMETFDFGGDTIRCTKATIFGQDCVICKTNRYLETSISHQCK